MAITATLVNTLTTTETVTGEVLNANSVSHLTNHSHTLNAGSTPPATKHVAKNVALVDGAATIDLTALAGWGTNNATEDMSGLKLQMFRAKANAENANPVTITPGASNGYDAFGASMSISLNAGQELSLYGNDSTPDVAGTDKTLDLAGTGTQEILIEMVFG